MKKKKRILNFESESSLHNKIIFTKLIFSRVLYGIFSTLIENANFNRVASENANKGCKTKQTFGSEIC